MNPNWAKSNSLQIELECRPLFEGRQLLFFTQSTPGSHSSQKKTRRPIVHYTQPSISRKKKLPVLNNRYLYDVDEYDDEEEEENNFDEMQTDVVVDDTDDNQPLLLEIEARKEDEEEWHVVESFQDNNDNDDDDDETWTLADFENPGSFLGAAKRAPLNATKCSGLQPSFPQTCQPPRTTKSSSQPPPHHCTNDNESCMDFVEESDTTKHRGELNRAQSKKKRRGRN